MLLDVLTCIWQVHRSSVFADACSSLLHEGTLKLPCGPRIVSPTFLSSLPESSHSHSRSSQSSVQPILSAGDGHEVGQILQTSEHADESAPDAGPGNAAIRSVQLGGDAAQGLVEEGEGHGPRKEFFALIGAEVSSTGGCLSSFSQSAYI